MPHKERDVVAAVPPYWFIVGLETGHEIATSSDSKIYTRYQIICGFAFFPLWRADLKISGFAVEFAGCVWTVALSGKKKLRIQKISGQQRYQ